MRRLTAIALALLLSITATAGADQSLGDLSDSFEEISRRVTRSVVQIITTGYGTQPGGAYAGLISKQRGTGSGVILDADGYIVTNAHVVDGARYVRVLIPLAGDEVADRSSILKGGSRTVGAQIVGVDRETDLAVIRVQETGLAALELGDSDGVRQGQVVLAYGSPLGLQNSVSMGVVSNVARQLQPEHPVVYIQTDATINPGNSGGPLVNASGDVVGINTMIFTQSGGSEGIGFAVPSNIVRNVFQQVRSTGRVRRGEIGVHAQTITPVLADGLGLQRDYGVVLGDVYPGGPAADAGLQPGDIILALDGKPMENGRQLDVNLYRKPVGQQVTVEYLRGGDKRTARVNVVERPNDPRRFEDMVSPEENLIRRLGVLAMDITPRIATLLPPRRQSNGVVVAAQSPEGPAWQEGFASGDIIYAINTRPVGDLDDLKTKVAALRTGDAVVVQVQRGRQMRYVSFEME